MSAAWRGMVVDYVRVRRSLGYKLEYTERLLFKFIDYLHAHDADAMTIEHAVGFATAVEDASPRWQALRLSAVRCFARWAHPQDRTVQVPPARLLPARVTRAAPYIYTDSQIAALLDAASRLRPAIRAATFRTLVALMAATGIRTGEAIGLDVSDLDQRTATLTVTGKYGKVRQLPLHPTRPERTDRLPRRARHSQRQPAQPYWSPCAAPDCYPKACTRLSGGWPSRRACTRCPRRAAPPPARFETYLRCLDDARCLLFSLRPGGVLPVLATWMGHADPNDTYWYLTGTAELLAAAAERVEPQGVRGRVMGS